MLQTGTLLKIQTRKIFYVHMLSPQYYLSVALFFNPILQQPTLKKTCSSDKDDVLY
jgi:hypothetical protein